MKQVEVEVNGAKVIVELELTKEQKKIIHGHNRLFCIKMAKIFIENA